MTAEMIVCHECRLKAGEKAGRWIILGEKEGGFEWIFLCIQCVRDWRKRGLEREGYSPKIVTALLDKEYPL